MELQDCAFPLLASTEIFDDPKKAFDGVNVALLVGARPRSKGMERADLLEANGQIFKPQGEALNAGAADDVKVLVVGNPANTNALIAHEQRARHPARALHRDDAPRPEPRGRAARRQARRRRRGRGGPRGVGQPLADDVPRPLQREGEAASARSTRSTWTGTRTSSSRASASAAPRSSRRAAPHRRRARPTRRSTTCTTGCTAPSGAALDGGPLDGSYGVEEGLISSFPVRVSGGEYEIVEGLEVNDFARAKIDATVDRAQGGARRACGELGPGLAALAPRGCQPLSRFTT